MVSSEAFTQETGDELEITPTASLGSIWARSPFSDLSEEFLQAECPEDVPNLAQTIKERSLLKSNMCLQQFVFVRRKLKR